MTEPPQPLGRVAHAVVRRSHDRRAGSICRCRRAASPRSSARTDAASRRCCVRWPGSSRHARARSCSTARRCTRRPTKEVARTLGLLPQSPIAPEGIVVADLVGRGRHPHQKLLARWTRARLRGRRAVARRDRDHRARRPRPSTSCRADSVSGCGSRWRSPRRPTSCCSTSRRRSSMSPTRSRCSTCSPTSIATRATTIVMVLHDINLAARYADHLFAMRDGEILAAGPPSEVVTSELIREVFDLDALVRPRSGLRDPDRPPPRTPPCPPQRGQPCPPQRGQPCPPQRGQPCPPQRGQPCPLEDRDHSDRGASCRPRLAPSASSVRR